MTASCKDKLCTFASIEDEKDGDTCFQYEKSLRLIVKCEGRDIGEIRGFYLN